MGTRNSAAQDPTGYDAPSGWLLSNRPHHLTAVPALGDIERVPRAALIAGILPAPVATSRSRHQQQEAQPDDQLDDEDDIVW